MKQVIKLGTVLAICVVTIINLYVMNKFVDTKHIHTSISSPNETPKTLLTLTGEEEETIQQVTLPIYNSKPNSGSMCHPDNSNGTDLDLVTSHCRKRRCMQHSKDVDENLLDLLSFQGVDVTSGGKEGCKMLWFAAMHETEGMCDGRGHTYSVDYSVALNSFLANAKDVLQPVLILGRYGTKYENSTDPSKLTLWAEDRGVRVL